MQHDKATGHIYIVPDDTIPQLTFLQTNSLTSRESVLYIQCVSALSERKDDQSARHTPGRKRKYNEISRGSCTQPHGSGSDIGNDLFDVKITLMYIKHLDGHPMAEFRRARLALAWHFDLAHQPAGCFYVTERFSIIALGKARCRLCT